MPRIEIGEVVQDTNGNALSGASCQVNKRETGAATVYSAETGAGTLANPIITDTAGRIEGWLEGGSYDIVVTPPTGSVYTQRFEAVSGRNVPIEAIGGTFPTTPADGEVVYYQVVEGVTWAFKYNAGSASAYKWEFIGGPPMKATEIATDETRANVAYGALATAGPTLTLPALAGDFDVTIACRAQADAAAAFEGFMSYTINGAAALDAHAATVVSSAQYDGGTHQRTNAHLALPSGTQFICQYKTQVASLYHWSRRTLWAIPVRVSG